MASEDCVQGGSQIIAGLDILYLSSTSDVFINKGKQSVKSESIFVEIDNYPKEVIFAIEHKKRLALAIPTRVTIAFVRNNAQKIAKI